MHATSQDLQRHNHCPSLLADRSVLDDNLQTLQRSHSSFSQRATAQYCKALDSYLELPSLLDPILSTHIVSLTDIIQSRLATDPSTTALSPSVILPARALYTLIKVRGPKRVATYFPHQVHNLRSLIPTLRAVESLPHSSSCPWHLRYILYRWLAVAIRVPFPLRTILTPESLSETFKHAQNALHDNGPIAEAATDFLARLLSRRDTAHFRIAIFDYARTHALLPSANPRIRTAALSLLASVFKHAHRDDLRPHIHPILQALPPPTTAPSTTEAHLLAKLSHRLALSFLPPRPAAWRYTRTVPILRRAPGHTGSVHPQTYSRLTPADTEALELVVELLLIALQQRDTVVRWSAAKGIARITSRLPSHLALDVIDAVLAIFHDIQQARSDAAWHGACLTIAELARRGLLLPTNPHFGDAFRAVHRASAFDVRRGANSVGAHVRDAACYAVWAVARAYAKEDVAAFAPVITQSMLPLALLDREVNCRRAAAAALQECVGRLSADLFEDGIKLITVAEYFSLGDRSAAYLVISPQVAQIARGVHFQPLLKELWNRKLMHWDPAVRALAAKSLAGFVDVDEQGAIVREVLPELVAMATQRGDMVYRHGAVLGIAELAKEVGYEGLKVVGAEVRRIPKLLSDKGLLTGRTGDEMQIACCHLIQSLATGAADLFRISPQGRTDTEEFLNFLETILGCGKEHLYAPATSSYTAICEFVISNDQKWHVMVMQRILDGITSSRFFEHQRGFALAAGACGDSNISDELVACLCRESSTNRDVEVRRNCAMSLGSLSIRILQDRITEILPGLARAMEDYATDERGDVGSWVREAAMQSSRKVVSAVYGSPSNILSRSFDAKTDGAILEVLNRIMEQCCSKIDRTRGVAGQVLRDICEVFSSAEDLSFSISALCRKLLVLLRSSPSANTEDLDISSWLSFTEGAKAFLALRPALCIPQVSRSVMRGFISTGGGLGQPGGYACDALTLHLRKKTNLSLAELELSEITQVIDCREERLLIPALKVLDLLFKRDALHSLSECDLKSLIVTVKNSWRRRLRDVKLISTAIGVLSEIASITGSTWSFSFIEESAGRDCLEALVIILGGPIPRLRRVAAENLYMILLEVDSRMVGPAASISNNEAEKAGEALNILADTSWEKLSIQAVRQSRNELCKVLGIRMPVAVKVAAAVKMPAAVNKLSSPR